PIIGKINWVYFREDKDDFEQSFAGLIELLRLHKDYVEQHTKFLIKALDEDRLSERKLFPPEMKGVSW
ncbi:MAG: hypothetical protein AAFS12_02920, partial [Cyanobacteria bacterium J06632_19]